MKSLMAEDSHSHGEDPPPGGKGDEGDEADLGLWGGRPWVVGPPVLGLDIGSLLSPSAPPRLHSHVSNRPHPIHVPGSPSAFPLQSPLVTYLAM